MDFAADTSEGLLKEAGVDGDVWEAITPIVWKKYKLLLVVCAPEMSGFFGCMKNGSARAEQMTYG